MSRGSPGPKQLPMTQMNHFPPPPPPAMGGKKPRIDLRPNVQWLPFPGKRATNVIKIQNNGTQARKTLFLIFK